LRKELLVGAGLLAVLLLVVAGPTAAQDEVGSQLAADLFVMHVAPNTLLAACAGTIGAAATIWLFTGKPEVSISVVGTLAGLVAITADHAGLDVAEHGSPGYGEMIGVLGRGPASTVAAGRRNPSCALRYHPSSSSRRIIRAARHRCDQAPCS
jgi:hypothetical protein